MSQKLVVLISCIAYIIIGSLEASCGVKQSSSLTQNSEGDIVLLPKPMNYNEFLIELGRTGALKILRDAGVPCNLEFTVLVDCEGNYVNHKILGDYCHPIAEKGLNESIGVLKFIPGSRNGSIEEMELEMNVKWTTW